MTDPMVRCESCGAVLPTPDAVCPRCEQELASAAANPASGRYRCPACSSRFDRASLAWYPPDAPWYWPQRQENQCPHCRSFLRDRNAIPFSTTEYAILGVLVVAAQFSPWRPGTQIGLLLAIAVFQYVRWRRAQSSLPVEEERYALQKPGR